MNILWGIFAAMATIQAVKFKRAAKVAQQVEKVNGRISVNAPINMMVKVDAGWYSFAYGKANMPAYRSFGVYNPNVVLLTITSCFCPGNFFSVYDNGQPILQTELSAPISGGKNGVNTALTCTTPVTNPNLCVEEPDVFSHGSVLLLPGKHNLTIVANQSPWNGGTAFLRADSACPSLNSFSEPVPCCLSTGTCSTVIVA